MDPYHELHSHQPKERCWIHGRSNTRHIWYVKSLPSLFSSLSSHHDVSSLTFLAMTSFAELIGEEICLRGEDRRNATLSYIWVIFLDYFPMMKLTEFCISSVTQKVWRETSDTEVTYLRIASITLGISALLPPPVKNPKASYLIVFITTTHLVKQNDNVGD